MWMDLLLALLAVTPFLLVTPTHLRSSESSGIEMPREASIPLLDLQASPTGPPRQ